MKPTSVYLAARFTRKAEMRQYAEDLDELGIGVTSRWVHAGAHEWTGTPDDAIPAGAQLGFAQDDLDDIDAADMLVIFTDQQGTRGGMWVELGYALGQGMPVLVVGPLANIFCAVADYRVDTWADALAFLAAMDEERVA